MKTLATALLHLASKLELWDDETVDPDAAVQAMEEIGAILADCSDAEKQALVAASGECAAECRRNDRAAAAEFFENFVNYVGME